ncbi:MAG: tetratricopeptide repeat protein [Lachnospiraceae bacterium]|nr:tetratricopeptide repeat protein [Lachnospiraceae bacterium]
MLEKVRYNRFQKLINKKFRETDGTEAIPELEKLSEKVTFNIEKNGINVYMDDFVGRSETIESINEAIKEEKKIIHVMGIDGIGKTDLIKQVYTSYKQEDSEYLPVYIHYEFSMDDSILQIFDVESDVKYIESVDYAWKYLVDLTKEKKILLFVDEVYNQIVDDESINRLYSLNSTVIVTSVDNIFLNSPDVVKIRLGSFSESESVELFLNNYELPVEEGYLDDLKYIVKESADNHPLTIKLLATASKNNDWDIYNLLSYLEECSFKMSSIYLYSDEMELVIKEYKKIFDILDLSENEINVLEAFALFPQNDYSLKFMNDWMAADIEADDIEPVASALFNKGLIERDEELKYSMSSVIAKIIIHIYKPDIVNHMSFIKLCDKYLQLYSLKIDDSKYSYWRIAENIINNMFNEDVYELGQLAIRAGKVFFERCEYERARSQFRRATVIYENVFSRSHIETAGAYFLLAQTYEKCGDYNNALSHYRVALEIQEAMPQGKEHESTSDTYSGLGSIYYKQGQYEKSIRFYLKSLEIREKRYGKYNLYVAANYLSIADVFYEMKSYEKAATYYTTAIEIREKLCDKNDIVVINMYLGLANIYRKTGKYSESIKHFKKIIEMYERVYGNKHLYITYAYNGMAGAYAKMQRLEKAKACCIKSIEMSESLYGKKSMAIATSYNAMALVCLEFRDLDSAEKYFALSLNIVENILGKDNIHSAQIYKSLGNINLKRKKYEEALNFYNHAGSIRKRALGATHPKTIEIAQSIENINKLMNDAKVVKLIEEEEAPV